MKLQVDTENKILTILTRVDLNELLSFIKEYGMESWTIEPETKVEWIIPTPHVPYIQRVDPYCPPYEITCSTT